MSWQTDTVTRENSSRAFCMSDRVNGASCWAAAIPIGHDSFTQTASYIVPQADFDKLYNSSKSVNPPISPF